MMRASGSTAEVSDLAWRFTFKSFAKDRKLPPKHLDQVVEPFFRSRARLRGEIH